MRELKTRMDRILGARDAEPTEAGDHHRTVTPHPSDLVAGSRTTGGDHGHG
ncbi:MAG: hypothetical protein ABSF33_12910 [Acidimicrobiales bacterium]|jgi:hypothetical protein